MTHHLTKPIRAIHFMVLAFLMTLGAQVGAANYKVGDVLYCQSEVGAMATARDDWEHRRWKPLQFKFQIASTRIEFGSTGYFKNDQMALTTLSDSYIHATDSMSLFKLMGDGRFVYASGMQFAVNMMTGTCDKF
jgi:hypothetical protein